MNQRPHLLPIMVAALAALGGTGVHAATSGYNTTWQQETAVRDTTALTRDQVQQELAAARSNPNWQWQQWGSEETIAPETAAAPSAQSRSQVASELQEWRSAGALETFGNEGVEQQTHERRAALNTQQAERYAAAQEAEQRRLARVAEEERMAAAAAAAAQQQPADPAAMGTVSGSGTSGMGAPATSSGETSSTMAAPAVPAPLDPQTPAAPSPDAAVDSTRQRLGTESMSAVPQPVPDQPGSTTRPLDGNPSAVPADPNVTPSTTPMPSR